MNLVRLLFVLVVLVGIVFLQVFLSKKESKWLGLILPIVSFVIALLPSLGIMVPPEGVTGGFVLGVIIIFLLANIPTIILLGIYFGCREKQRRTKQLDKMNIQDLQ